MLSVRMPHVLILISAILTVAMIALTLYLIARPSSNVGETIIIVDSDGGVDDLMALLLLLKAYRVRVKTVTTVSGITGASNATRNIKTLLSILNKQEEIHVYSGRDSLPENRTEGYYGWDGLGDFLPSVPINRSDKSMAAQAIVQTVSQYPGQVIILCIGPLTNLAEALDKQADLFKLVKQVIIVGASYKGGGNVSPGVEFNMASDPQAASHVFKMIPKENPIEVMPLETIESFASFTLDWRKEIGQINSKMMNFFNKAENKSLDKGPSWICYDQAGAAAIVSPEVRMNKTRGVIAINARGAASFSPVETGNINVITVYKKEILKILLLDALSST